MSKGESNQDDQESSVRSRPQNNDGTASESDQPSHQDTTEQSRPQNDDGTPSESDQPFRDEDSDDLESQEREGLLKSDDTIQNADKIWRGEEQINQARKLLYLSHMFDQFSEGTWQFCIILFLAAFSNYESLVLVSTYGLCSGLLVCYFGPQLGRFIDGADRLFTARLFIGLQSSAVLLATTCCYMLLAANEKPFHFSDESEDDSNNNSSYGVPTDAKSIFLLVGVHLLGAIAQVLDSGFTVAIERDWIVVMSQYITFAPEEESTNLQKQKEWLSETNVALKQIDLSCQIIAPAVAGFVVAGWDGGGENHKASDLKSAALFVGCLCAVALVVEYICSTKIFYAVQTLAIKPIPSANNSSPQDTSCGLFGLSRGMKIFMSQEVSWAGISLSLLYSNVLTFGAIMTAYLVWRGISLEQIGIWRGVSAAVGLAGTFVYKILSARIGLVNSGMLSVTVQFCCLSIGYASLFVDNLTISFAMLIVGVCSSRIGLWVFDISVTQLMQLNVADDVRGEVGGVQSSLNSFFFLLSFGLGILLPDPASFHVYASIGYIFVAAAVVCFAVGVYSKRDSLAKA
mmetsp:Transcript_17728/g.43729  ORF Transcript_17728/g.43729 Transcript_17728/m.43729 type:complete len:572 (+) Transcript_17728:275-1990(+)